MVFLSKGNWRTNPNFQFLYISSRLTIYLLANKISKTLKLLSVIFKGYYALSHFQVKKLLLAFSILSNIDQNKAYFTVFTLPLVAWHLCIGQVEASTSTPGHTPGVWYLCRPGEQEIWLSVWWGIWIVSPQFHVKSLGAAIIMADTVLVYLSWKSLCLCGQLVTRKGLKPALCRIWRYLNFINIFNIGFRLDLLVS